MPVKTSKVTDRRALRFGRMNDLVRDLESLGDGEKIRTAGNWTAAQNVDHIARLIEQSLDGFPRMAPFPMRLMGRLMRSSAMNKPMPAGYKLPKSFVELHPPAEVTWDDAMARLRGAVDRIEAGEQMTAVSPIFGAVAHEEWVQLHCRHAEMHFSFLHRGDA